MMCVDNKYRRLINKVRFGGIAVKTRNSGCVRITGYISKFDSTPLVCLRRTAWKNCLREWEWFMSGSNNIKHLHESVRPWWQAWADKWGYINYNYSEEFRKWTMVDDQGQLASFDQIQHLIDGIRNHPYSRRNVITTWNTAHTNASDCPITNCHGTMIQCFVRPTDNGEMLDLCTYQRSCDLIVGVPHNWFQYWAFLVWLAHRTGKLVGELKWIGGDVHIYDAHADLAVRIAHGKITQEPPQLLYKPSSDEFKAEDFTLDREYTPTIDEKAQMIV
jgi:thymidylate synthase